MIPITAAQQIQSACGKMRDAIIELGTARKTLGETPGADRAFAGAIGLAVRTIDALEKGLREGVEATVARQLAERADPEAAMRSRAEAQTADSTKGLGP